MHGLIVKSWKQMSPTAKRLVVQDNLHSAQSSSQLIFRWMESLQGTKHVVKLNQSMSTWTLLNGSCSKCLNASNNQNTKPTHHLSYPAVGPCLHLLFQCFDARVPLHFQIMNPATQEFHAEIHGRASDTCGLNLSYIHTSHRSLTCVTFAWNWFGIITQFVHQGWQLITSTVDDSEQNMQIMQDQTLFGKKTFIESRRELLNI